MPGRSLSSRVRVRRPFVSIVAAAMLAGLLVAAPAVPAEASSTPSVPGAFVSLEPTRVLDTRVGNGAPQAAVGANRTVSLQVAGRAGVPSQGVSAVVVNVTVTGPSAPGFVTVYPSGKAQPTASNLNFTAGQTIPNLVTVKVGSDGRIALTNNSAGSVHLIADVAGYFLSGTPAAPGAFTSLDPARLLDTRVGNGAPASPVASFGTVRLQVTGRAGVPETGVSAVVVNVTVTGPAAGGFVTVYPNGTSQPTASNLNFSPDQTIPNLVTVKVGSDGRIALTNNAAGSTHLIADVAGYYLAGTPTEPGTFVSLDPARLLDTRVGNGAPTSPVKSFATVGVTITGRAGVPSSDVSAVVLNTTVTGPTAGGFITVYPSGAPMPTASNLNFSTWQTIPNLGTVKLGADGKIAATNNSAGTTDLITDVAGYYLGDPAVPSYAAAAQQLTRDLPATTAWQSANALAGLTVAAAGSTTGYSRDQFPHWRDATNNGWPPIPNQYCDARQATLYRDGTGVDYDSKCTISGGTWLDPYTAAVYYTPSDVDIDHVVPLAAAWRSGASAWTREQRTAYANDRLVLVAVDDAANQSKGDKGPEAWKPQNAAAHCLYAKRWIAVKSTYALTVTTAEKAALTDMLGTCTD